MKLKKIIATLIICSSLQAFSQHKIELKNVVKEQIINSYTGTLLVKTTKSLLAIDPKTKQILWTNNDFNKVSFSEYSEIPYTPIILFTQKPLINSKVISTSFNTKGASKKIMNIITGKVLFDSKKEGFKAVYNTLILPEKKAILVDGIKNKEFVIALFNYETGKQIWETKGVESKFFQTVKGALLDEEKIILDIEKNIYWLKNKQLIKINGETGAILSEKENINSIAMNVAKDILFVFSNKVEAQKLNVENIITALDTRTLQDVWNEPAKIWGSISRTAIDQDEIVAITSKGFNIINIKTGLKKWERSESLPLIKKIVPVSTGYLIVQDKFLVRIDNQGKKAWDKKIKISFSSNENPIHIIENQSQALYITPSKANIVNIENGTKVWKEDVLLNSASFLDRNLKISEQNFKVWDDTRNSQVTVFSENSFYIFDKVFVEKPAAVNGFDFKRGAPQLRSIDNGYFIFKNNQYFCYDLSGELRYKKEYHYLKNSNIFDNAFYWTKRGFGTYTSALGFVSNQITQTLNTVLISKDLGVLSTISSTVYGTYQSYQNSLSSLTELNELGLDSNMSTIFKRIKTGRKNEGNILIVSATEVESKIIRLDINSGSETLIKTYENTYSDLLVDQIEQQVYFFEKKTILIEDVNK